MNQTNSPLGTVRRKANFLPTVFVSDEFDSAVITRLASCFKTLILCADRDGDGSWQKLNESLRAHGLLEVKVPQELLLNPLHIEVARKDGEKEVLSYTSSEPLSFGFETLSLDLDRARVCEPVYLAEVASIYAYLFVWRLFGHPAYSDAEPNSGDTNLFAPATVVVPRIDSAALSEYMRSHHRGEVSAASLTKFLIGRTIEPMLDELPVFRAFGDFGARVHRRLCEGLANSTTGAIDGALTKDSK